MELTEFKTEIKKRADALVDAAIANEDWLESVRTEYNKMVLEYLHDRKEDPETPHPWQYTMMDLESGIRFGMATKPHQLVGDDYFHTSTYDVVMVEVRSECIERLGKVIYKNAWNQDGVLVE